MAWSPDYDAEVGSYEVEGASWDDEALDGYEDEDAIAEMSEALRGSLSEDYGHLPDDLVERALFDMMDSMSAAEGFNFGKALRQIAKPVSKALSDPVVGQIASTVAPIAGSAVGAFFGGPAGMAIGGQLGGAAAQALGPKAKKPPATAQSTSTPSVLNGSIAAAKGLVLSQKPEVLQSMLSLALGQHGKKTVSGVPTGAVMNMLANIFKQAASDADEIQYWASRSPDYMKDAEGDPEVAGDRADALYAHWLDAESTELLGLDADEFSA